MIICGGRITAVPGVYGANKNVLTNVSVHEYFEIQDYIAQIA
jgi:hypothetical protein